MIINHEKPDISARKEVNSKLPINKMHHR